MVAWLCADRVKREGWRREIHVPVWLGRNEPVELRARTSRGCEREEEEKQRHLLARRDRTRKAAIVKTRESGPEPREARQRPATPVTAASS